MAITSERSKPRIGVVSGRYPASRFESHINHRAYCARHGYTYIYCNWPTGASNRYMNKIEYIKAYYDLFDYIFWIDDDAFFIRLEQGLEDFLPKGDSFLSICSSPVVNGIFTYVSSGQFMIQCSPTGRSFIDATQQVDLRQVRAWWSDDLGHFTRGDQDCFVYLMKADDRFAQYDRHSYHAFNSRVDDLLVGKDVFLLHITGTPQVKQKRYQRVQRYLARGPSLLPTEEAARWNLLLTPTPWSLVSTIPGRVVRRLRRIIRAR